METRDERFARLLRARLARTGRTRPESPQQSSEREQRDRTNLSPFSEEVRMALAATLACAEREDPRLAALRERIRAGRYRVPAELIAEALLSHARPR